MSSRFVMPLLFCVCLPPSIVVAQVGKRQSIKGEKSKSQEVQATNSINFGNVVLTNAMARAWREKGGEDRLKSVADESSLYVLGAFSGQGKEIEESISRSMPSAKVLETSDTRLFVFANPDDARKLVALEGIDIVEAVSSKKKITSELQAVISNLLKLTTTSTDDPKKLKQDASVLQIVPEGQAPPISNSTPIALADGSKAVEVSFHLFVNQPEEALNELISSANGKVLASGSDSTITVVRALVPAAQIETIAGSNAVREVTLHSKFIKHNDLATKILLRNPPSAYTPPINGEGQVVGHSDSGLDNGNTSTIHPAFRGRVKMAISLGRPNDWSDKGGHGTHTAASILGAGKYPGIAPGALLVHQSLDDVNGGLSGIPTPLGKLFQVAYDEGARVHSNSWGVPAIDSAGNNSLGGVYMDGAEVDSWTWNNGTPRDMLIVFSAGNDGDYSVNDGRSTVTSPGTAKNALTVGASENVRAGGGSASDSIADLASFSSRGPTKENRIKPDVVAPGTWIASARTHGDVTHWTNDVESVTIGTQPTDWQVTSGFGHTNTTAMNGTSSWNLRRAKNVTFQDILRSPKILLPAGHELTFRVWVRGNASGLDTLQLGFQSTSGVSVFPSVQVRDFAQWTCLSATLPRELLGTSVRLVVVAQESTGLPSDLDIAVDNYSLSTFGNWDALSTLGFAKPDDADDRSFTFSGGTSMSAPLAAGCATLVRQSLQNAGTPAPTAELVKAIIINSADTHQGSRPNFRSGWGLINLRRAIESDFDFDFESLLENSESIEYSVNLTAGTNELRVSLVWADVPNASIVNDLDLQLTDPTGLIRRGTEPNGNSPDRTNNVEGIDVTNPLAGTWKVRVTAHKVTVGTKQPFAMVISKF